MNIMINALIIITLFQFSYHDLSPKESPHYKVLNLLKHDETCYTQGIFILGKGEIKSLFQSCGLYRKSSLSKIDFPSLTNKRKIYLSESNFGEGIALCKNQNILYQLTYKENEILKYSYPEINFLGKIQMDPSFIEGWGLATNGENEDELILTNGSNHLFYLDCNNDLSIKRILKVTDIKGKSINKLNDLIYAKGYIWCIKYLTSMIYKINPSTGIAEKEYDLSELKIFELKQNKNRLIDVLNGIAYDEERDLFILTGKLWSYYYEIQFKDEEV